MCIERNTQRVHFDGTFGGLVVCPFRSYRLMSNCHSKVCLSSELSSTDSENKNTNAPLVIIAC